MIAAMAAMGLCVSSCDAGEKILVLSPVDFQKSVLSDSTAVVLDVRRPDEYAEGHLSGAQSLDWLDAETFAQGMERLDKTKTYYVYCRSGRRSHDAAEKMMAVGLHVVDMEGGYLAWTDKGLPVVKAEADEEVSSH